MERIEIADFLNYRFLSGIQARGERAVFVQRSANEAENSYFSDIWLLENGSVRRLTANGKSGAPIWEDDNNILFPAMREKQDQERAQNGESFSVWYRLNIHGGEAERAFELPVSCGQLKRLGKLWFFTVQIDRANPDEYKMDSDARAALAKQRKENEDYHILTDCHYRMNGAGFFENTITALFLWNPETGETQRLTGPDTDVGFAKAFGSEILFGGSAYSTTPNQYNQVYAYSPETGETRTVYGGSEYGIYDAHILGGQPVFLASDYQKHGGNQNGAFYTVAEGEMQLLCDPDLSTGCSVGTDCRLGGGSYAQVYGDALYFTSTVESRCELKKLTRDGKITTVNNAEGSLDCFCITEKGTILGIGFYENRLQEIYAIGHGKKVTRLTGINTSAWEGKFVAAPHKLSIRSAGRRIDGWVLLPKDFDPEKRYPAVLDIHGGPKTVYGQIPYHEMQVWASRGYFVFFCNPFGSDGRGSAFADLRGKYGTIDYQNIMDFTDAVLAKYPQIDESRVAVTGGSYGGFMTNWIIGHTDRFACAATQRSISNWFSFYGVSDIGIEFNNDQNNATIFDGQKQIWDHSPLKYAGNVVTPTLFIHSDEDWRCPIDQGLQLYTALLERGVDTRFVWFKGENHDLSRSGKPKHRIKRLTEITEWIEKYTRE